MPIFPTSSLVTTFRGQPSPSSGPRLGANGCHGSVWISRLSGGVRLGLCLVGDTTSPAAFSCSCSLRSSSSRSSQKCKDHRFRVTKHQKCQTFNLVFQRDEKPSYTTYHHQILLTGSHRLVAGNVKSEKFAQGWHQTMVALVDRAGWQNAAMITKIHSLTSSMVPEKQWLGDYFLLREGLLQEWWTFWTWWIMVVTSPLIRPYFLRGVALGGSPWISIICYLYFTMTVHEYQFCRKLFKTPMWNHRVGQLYGMDIDDVLPRSNVGRLPTGKLTSNGFAQFASKCSFDKWATWKKHLVDILWHEPWTIGGGTMYI